MSQKNLSQSTIHDLSIFALLLAIGVVGRWAAPTWNFTPLAAVTALGGFYFRRPLVAMLLPVSVLAASDLFLPTHDNLAVMIAVHGMMLVPFLLGRLARRSLGYHRMAYWGLCGVVPATAFFVVTNFAVWAFKSNYEISLAGLAACYTAGLPFYRAMLAGDLFYPGVLLACFAAARISAPVPVPVRVK